MPQEQDYYRLLGVPRDAPEREIKRAYYELARVLHPDKAASPEEAATNSERLALISQAYNSLKDKKKRAEYDSALAGNSAMPTMAQASSAAAAEPVKRAGSSAGVGPAPAMTMPGQSGSQMQAQKVAMGQRAFVRGMQHFRAAEFEKARPFFEAALANDPDSEPHYHHKYAQCLLRTQGGFSKAVEAAQRAVELDTYNVEFKLTLGEIYESAGVSSKAKGIYDEVLKWDAENSRAKQRLAFMNTQAQDKKPFLEKLMPSLFGKKK